MRVTIKHDQSQTGLLKQKPLFTVTVRTEFTAQEAAAIRERGLEDLIVFEIPNARDIPPSRYSVQKLLNGAPALHFADFVAARNITGEIKQGMQNLKNIIDEALTIAPGHTETLEL